MTRCLAAALVVLVLAGCNDLLPDISFERMIDQPRGKAYRASPYFADGRLMQAPPDGTVPHDRLVGPPELIEGLAGADYVKAVPLSLDRALLTRGRSRYELFCATCHGIDGSGSSQVAQNMSLRRPPNLVEEPVRSFPAGRVFRVITGGYGLMPEYERALGVHDRWAVVAYLRALQRSQSTPLAALPQNLRTRAMESLR
ncbi:MAG TPA: cytochrome c [Polyangiales bacterium]|nr:cytochrome c [Polyangiales bacterium]